MSRLVVSLAIIVAVVLASPAPRVVAQIDPEVRDDVLPAAVQIALLADVTQDGETFRDYLPIGSGTVVSPDGLILTNWHVVDMVANQAELDALGEKAPQGGLSFDLDDTRLLILTTDESDMPEPAYVGQVVATDKALDLAVLQITEDADGQPVDPVRLDLAFVPPADSSTIRQGDAIHLFGYPAIGGGTLQYTAGVVSGFNFEEGIDGRAWITTDATMAGGSSGGTAVNGEGQLVGIPTQGTELDCRPGDTNRDGTIDAGDVGCIPVGGSIGQLRPINLALPLLREAGWATDAEADAAEAEVTPTKDETEASVESDLPVNEEAPAIAPVYVYDYTINGSTWSSIIHDTVDEFNAVIPAGAPPLVYTPVSNEIDCLDLTNTVRTLSGIIFCETYRAEEFSNTPPGYWSWLVGTFDDDTTRIVFNSQVSPGNQLAWDLQDALVCKKLMHVYTGVQDKPGADPAGSCLLGDLRSPGPVDIQIMEDRFSVTDTESSRKD